MPEEDVVHLFGGERERGRERERVPWFTQVGQAGRQAGRQAGIKQFFGGLPKNQSLFFKVHNRIREGRYLCGYNGVYGIFS